MEHDKREIILRIYDTIADQRNWQPVLDEITDRLNARGCLVFELGETGLATPHMSSWYEPAALEDYIRQHRVSELADHEIFRKQSLAHDAVDIVSDSVLYEDLEEFRARKNVRHVMQFGILHRAAALLNKDNPNVSRFSVQFRSDRKGITAAESAYLNELLPHIAKALDLGRPARQLALEHQSMLAAMDRLKIGVCVLDGKGRVVVANEEFSRQLDTYKVFRTSLRGELMLLRDGDQMRLEALKADAVNHGKFGARPRKEAISTDNKSYLCIEISPLYKSEDLGAGVFDGCILYSTDTSMPVHCHTSPLKLAYRLTNAELDLAESIAEGLTNAQIAERRGRAVATVNAQVKSILSKTHCSTRTQFVRLLMSFGADFIREPENKAETTNKAGTA
ncbi:helix-turn-helix transcriptional regulator [Hoeflea prorocentri]|uniref:Helix-turn-helix transcriptional regulator n=1 Tax=Hoeflea prorocentri TaxID=1922333 RepID=A0A9X3UH83_9HYPH|nr:helix-turn-helix transcriptional regulator [Hoeflea prorocentri]MCY6380604.1 helix-turn-helix transcriptional regulator [Hoeflea prorocentri]MDA5398404.1 helix-turn-helix transcriptional regulator [Hoeflea prorocentri]